MRAILIILVAGVLTGCRDNVSHFAAYKDAEAPVLLGRGELSVDSVQWNNVFVPATRELYFTKMGRSASVIFKTALEKGSFTPAEMVGFPEGSPHSDVYVDPKGDLMLFSSLMPEHEVDTITDWNIWKSERKDGIWSAPEPFFPQNVEGNQFYPWLTDSGNLYFAITPHGSQNSDLYVSEFANGTYLAPKPLPGKVNSVELEGDAYVASDESFLIFAGFNRAENLGKSDLYIAFRENGLWSEPVWLGEEINSAGYDGSPFVTPDGRFLIFTSSRGSSDDQTFFNHYIVPFDIGSLRDEREVRS